MTMSTSDALAAPRRRPRLLVVSTWLGAGAVTVGVGAAMAGASGVAQADTGDHHVANSTSAADAASKSSAGPKVAAASHVSDISHPSPPKPVHTTGQAFQPATAKAPSATAVAAASAGKRQLATFASPSPAATTSTSQTISTPFGPIKITSTSTSPGTPFSSGPVGTSVRATTPVGKAEFSLSGSSTYDLLTTTNTVKFTDGTFIVPGTVSLLLDAAGPVVVGAHSLMDSGNAFTTAVRHLDLVGAAVALLAAGFNLGSALLVGHTTIDLPLPSSAGPTVTVHVPFGGLFASLQPVTVAVPAYSHTEIGFTAKVDASHVSLHGTRLGGIFAGFM
jgi:hypothetical protein